MKMGSMVISATGQNILAIFTQEQLNSQLGVSNANPGTGNTIIEIMNGDIGANNVGLIGTYYRNDNKTVYAIGNGNFSGAIRINYVIMYNG